MTGKLITIAFLAGICVMNALYGRHWSKLDHNPWAGKFLGGTFSTPAPGLNPGSLSVEALRRRGRHLMLAQPILFVLGTVLVLVLPGR